MQLIRTAEELARLLETDLEPPLRTILEGHRDRLAEYSDFPLEELAVFAVCGPGDTEASLAKAIGRQPIPWEYVAHHDGWIEAVAILEDGGLGWVIAIPDRPNTDKSLLQIG